MTNLTVTYNRTTNTFTLTNISGIEYTFYIYALDENDVFVLVDTVVIAIAGTYDYVSPSDNFYKFEDQLAGEFIVYFADHNITECLSTISKTMICADFDCSTITSFNSMVMSSQLLYNLIVATFVNTDTITTLGDSEISILHTSKILITRLTKYCDTLDDCNTC